MNRLSIGDFCTLPTSAQPLRLIEFDELFRRQTDPPRRVQPHQVEFTFATAEGLYDQVSDLVARESACCSFFDFSIMEQSQGAADQSRLVFRVGVPARHGAVLEALTDRAVAVMGEAGP
jgi:hypothetical protein